eukprot:10241719-Alexandrium_andersonii.AAC.1
MPPAGRLCPCCRTSGPRRPCWRTERFESSMAIGVTRAIRSPFRANGPERRLSMRVPCRSLYPT